ncbi:MAG TPA: DUF4142 domain-containing protein [Bryobacteraceae bacterium]|jgi:putative membrane protein|nr:DUF4142 domain-containing protein [Bryobacteraceae bacterium]
MSRTSLVATLLAASLVSPLSFAQLNQLSADDKDFIEYAGEFDLSSVRLASLAQTKGTTPAVKAFARTLEREHTADLRKLTAIAGKTGGIVPNTLDDPHAAQIKQVAKAKDAAFDHQFLKTVVLEHEQALASFKREADGGSTPELQAYAKALLPYLERHMKQAKKLAGETS